jgi:hypothetical protein
VKRLTRSEYLATDLGPLIRDGVSVEVVDDETGRVLFTFGPCVADPTEEETELRAEVERLKAENGQLRVDLSRLRSGTYPRCDHCGEPAVLLLYSPRGQLCREHTPLEWAEALTPPVTFPPRPT